MQSPREKLAAFFRTHKRMPSYSEMLKLFGYKTKSAAHYAVKKLIDEGIIAKDKTGRLIPKKLEPEIKVLGLVEAGFPSPAEEELVDTMNLDDFLIKNKEASFILKVKGDSMEEAGIFEGDLVIVERGKAPKSGDIVIAQVDGEYTMKYYREKRGRVYLEPANKKYKPIYPTTELKIDAIVKAVIRKY
jgi:SOS regulatory protein LexA